jgi:hypothetical protein
VGTKTGSDLASFPGKFGAGEESRTLDLNLGKVALYQLSYSRIEADELYGKSRFPGNYRFQASGSESFRYHAIDTSVSTAAI